MSRTEYYSMLANNIKHAKESYNVIYPDMIEKMYVMFARNKKSVDYQYKLVYNFLRYCINMARLEEYELSSAKSLKIIFKYQLMRIIGDMSFDEIDIYDSTFKSITGSETIDIQLPSYETWSFDIESKFSYEQFLDAEEVKYTAVVAVEPPSKLDIKVSTLKKLLDRISNDICPICHSEINDDSLVRVTQCGHPIHTSCIKIWESMDTSKSCPVCRRI
jgi:hypothetical protein